MKRKKVQRQTNWAMLIGAIVLSQSAGLIGSVFTASSIPTWYATLVKPWFTPPNWIFGPVWTFLYFLMGVSLYRLWSASRDARRRLALVLFFIQLGLNTLWSIAFFGHQNIGLGLAVIVFLWFAIVTTIWKASRVDRQAGLLLLPYLGWVTFAIYLNYTLGVLNR